MSTTVNAGDGTPTGPGLMPGVTVELLDVNAVAKLLGGCSHRHIYRLSDAGRMPCPIKLGRLVRWRRSELVDWIDHGCPHTPPNKVGQR